MFNLLRGYGLSWSNRRAIGNAFAICGAEVARREPFTAGVIDHVKFFERLQRRGRLVGKLLRRQLAVFRGVR